MILLSKIVYWFLIRFCRLSKQEKKMEELARKQSFRNQIYVPKDLLETECDVQREAEDWTDDPESPGVGEDRSLGLCEMECQGDTSPGPGEGFLSRAGSVCSIKIRHQMTVLRMFFGGKTNNNE